MKSNHYLAAIGVLALAFGTACAHAALVDTEQYVQDGLLLHYDGIRNAGAKAAHATEANTWVNLGSGGAAYNLTRLNGKGVWTEDGYKTANDDAFWSKQKLEFPASYTIQMLVDAKTADQTKGNMGYLFFPTGTYGTDKKRWQACSLVVREDSNSAGRRLRANVSNTTSGNLDLMGNHFTYVTLRIDNTALKESLFPGVLPNSGTDKTTKAVSTFDTGTSTWGLCGNPDSSKKTVAQGIVGTIKSFRFYSRALTEAEIAQNRRVDEARFFGGPKPELAATNAVIASTPSFLGGTEVNGAYQVDADGYTFTAPATKTDRGIDYALTGYTLETWNADDGTWGEPVAHEGKSACAVTDVDKVRITWKYQMVGGLVTPELATAYGVEDYVQDGLIMHYDGIRNVGANKPHDPEATVWHNLAPCGGSPLQRYGYATKDLKVSTSATVGTFEDGSAWENDGFRFSGRGQHFYSGENIDFPAKYTMQVCLDVKSTDQSADVSTIGYLTDFYAWDWSTISLRNKASDNTYLYLAADQRLAKRDVSRRPALPLDNVYIYATALFDELEADGVTVGAAALFSGTTAPDRTKMTLAGYASTGWMTGNVARVVQTPLALGCFHGNYKIPDAQGFVGKLRNLRLYDRVLSDAELALNRMIDDARFFGALGTTNVVLATDRQFLHGDEAEGVYAVLGSHTFTAPATATDRGIDYALAGYTLETWDDAAGAWGEAVAYESASYAYTAGESPAKVRLTWRWKATHGLRTAADYDVQDYVVEGLQLHFDAIRNMGATTPHDTFNRRWVNVAPGGGHDLMWQSGGKSAITWADKAFDFNGCTCFWLTGPYALPAAYTMQTLVDAKTTDQANSIGYLVFGRAMGDDNGYWSKCSIGIRKSAYDGVNNSYYLVEDTALGGRPYIETVDCDYATAILNKTYALMFTGTDPEAVTGKGRYVAKGGKQAATYTFPNGFMFGGVSSGNSSQDLNGQFKSFRYYDRVLAKDELEWNRNVDSARYFGTLATTNVFVRPAHFGNGATETGAFKVEGSWTFTATDARDADGEIVKLLGYTLETLKDGEWTDKTLHAGSSYTYEEGASPAAVRLTWRWNVGMVILVR